MKRITILIFFTFIFLIAYSQTENEVFIERIKTATARRSVGATPSRFYVIFYY
jgi:hypothetical protein